MVQLRPSAGRTTVVSKLLEDIVDQVFTVPSLRLLLRRLVSELRRAWPVLGLDDIDDRVGDDRHHRLRALVVDSAVEPSAGRGDQNAQQRLLGR